VRTLLARWLRHPLHERLIASGAVSLVASTALVWTLGRGTGSQTARLTPKPSESPSVTSPSSQGSGSSVKSTTTAITIATTAPRATTATQHSPSAPTSASTVSTNCNPNFFYLSDITSPLTGQTVPDSGCLVTSRGKVKASWDKSAVIGKDAFCRELGLEANNANVEIHSTARDQRPAEADAEARNLCGVPQKTTTTITT
jgi:hypothetical protein